MQLKNNLPYTLIIGDIHGCLDEFNELLEKVNNSVSLNKVNIISVGDLVDRGPYSHGVLQAWDQLQNKYLVMGNHESKSIKRGWTYRGDHDANIDGARMIQEPLNDHLMGVLNTALPWLSFKHGDQTYLCIHGGLFPYWLAKSGNNIANLPNKDSTNKVLKSWKLTTMVRHIDLEKGQMVGLGAETPQTPYWAELYGKVILHGDSLQNSKEWDFRLLDENQKLVHILFGHQPHKMPENELSTPYQHATPLDYGVPFGDHLVGLLFGPEKKEYIVVKAHKKYSKRIDEL